MHLCWTCPVCSYFGQKEFFDFKNENVDSVEDLRQKFADHDAGHRQVE